MKIFNAFMFMAFGLIASNVFSAEVKISNDQFNKGAIFISGTIEKGDYEKVTKVTKEYVNVIMKGSENELRFILNSSGGNVEEAIKIGLLFHKMLAQVYVWGNRLYRKSDKEAQWILNERKKGWFEENVTQNYVILIVS